MLNLDHNQFVFNTCIYTDIYMYIYMSVLECFNPVQLETLPLEESPAIETPSPLPPKEVLKETPEKVEKASYTKNML